MSEPSKFVSLQPRRVAGLWGGQRGAPRHLGPAELEFGDADEADERRAAGWVASGLGKLEGRVRQLRSAGQLDATQAGGGALVAQQPAKLGPLRLGDGALSRQHQGGAAADCQKLHQLFEPVQVLRPGRLQLAGGLRRQRVKLGEQGSRLLMQRLERLRRGRHGPCLLRRLRGSGASGSAQYRASSSSRAGSELSRASRLTRTALGTPAPARSRDR